MPPLKISGRNVRLGKGVRSVAHGLSPLWRPILTRQPPLSVIWDSSSVTLAVFLSLCTALSALGLSKGPLKWHWTLEGRVKQKGGYSQHPQEWLFLWIVVWERETHHRLLVWGLKIPGKGSRAGAAWCFFLIMPLAGQLVPVKDSSQTTCALALISKVLNDIIKKKHLHFLREIFLIRWPC